MRPHSLAALATTLLCAALAATGTASATPGAYDNFYDLATRNLKPAPLVPVAVPPSLTPLDKTLHHVTRRTENSYVFRFEHLNARGQIDRRVGVEGGVYKSFAPPLKQARNLGLIIKKTKVRKRKAYTIRSRSMQSLQLLWKENGIIYTVSTPTDRKISLKDLKVVANGLQTLQREYIGGFYDKTGGQGAVAVTTDKSIAASLEWGGACTSASGDPVSPRGGFAKTALIPLQGASFAFNFLPGMPANNPWTVSASGSVTADAVLLNYRATATIEGDTCDSGPITFSLDKRAAP